MHTSRPFEIALQSAWPPPGGKVHRALIAVSGGADSVSLVCGLDALGSDWRGELAVGHFNHRLRPGADDDQTFVERLAQQLGLPFFCGSASGPEGLRCDGDGLEAAARAARYDFLTGAAERFGARYLLTAHTADDQLETILHHLLRGTSLTGLAGMGRVRPLSPAVTLVRPLLDVPRQLSREYLESIGQPWREDPSNLDRSHTRNRIRHELLPVLESHFGGAAAASILRLGALARESQDALAHLLTPYLAKALVERAADRIAIDVAQLAGLPIHAVRELLRLWWRGQGWPQQAMGYTEWNQLAELAVADCDPPGVAAAARAINLPGNVQARRSHETLILTRLI